MYIAKISVSYRAWVKQMLFRNYMSGLSSAVPFIKVSGKLLELNQLLYNG